LLTNINLVIKGNVDGQRRGYLFQPASQNYRADRQLLAPVTRASLVAKVMAGATITIMGVPPGTGMRMGIDRNLDGVLDGDTPSPTLRIAAASTNTVVAWSTNAAGFVLETSAALPNSTNWSAETSLRGQVGSEFNVTNAPIPSSRFFRLKEL
jgi:hypothetical protein